MNEYLMSLDKCWEEMSWEKIFDDQENLDKDEREMHWRWRYSLNYGHTC